MLDGPSSRAPVERSWQSWRSSLDAVIRSIRSRPARAALALVAAAMVLLVAWWAFRPPSAPRPEAVLPVATSAAPAAAGRGPSVSAATPTTVVVHVAGAVVRPGVLRLPTGARVVDAIDAAGGTTPDADPSRVNLAALLADGAWIHIPQLGADSPPPPPSGGAGGSGNGSSSDGAPLDLNAATAEQLEELPGIGPATAAAIVEHRTRNGPFPSVDALTDVPGIGAAKLAQLQSLVRV